METVTVSPKYQIVIPKSVRAALQLNPGQKVQVVAYDNRIELITGDAVHSPIQFAHPELAAARFDADHELSTATRRRLIERYVDRDTLLLGTHFAPPTAGHLRTVDGGVVFST